MKIQLGGLLLTAISNYSLLELHRAAKTSSIYGVGKLICIDDAQNEEAMKIYTILSPFITNLEKDSVYLEPSLLFEHRIVCITAIQWMRRKYQEITHSLEEVERSYTEISVTWNKPKRELPKKSQRVYKETKARIEGLNELEKIFTDAKSPDALYDLDLFSYVD